MVCSCDGPVLVKHACLRAVLSTDNAGEMETSEGFR